MASIKGSFHVSIVYVYYLVCLSVCQSFSPLLWSRLKYVWTTGWIIMKSDTDVCGSQRIHYNDFDYLVSSTMKVTFVVFDWNVSITIGWIFIKLVTHIHGPLGMNCNDFISSGGQTGSVLWFNTPKTIDNFYQLYFVFSAIVLLWAC